MFLTLICVRNAEISFGLQSYNDVLDKIKEWNNADNEGRLLVKQHKSKDTM